MYICFLKPFLYIMMLSAKNHLQALLLSWWLLLPAAAAAAGSDVGGSSHHNKKFADPLQLNRILHNVLQAEAGGQEEEEEDQVVIISTSVSSQSSSNSIRRRRLETYEYTGGTVTIRDADFENPAVADIQVTDNVEVCDVDVSVDIRHSYSGDLLVLVIGPDENTASVLAVGNCADVDNMIERFDDAASATLGYGESTTNCGANGSRVRPNLNPEVDELDLQSRLSVFNGMMSRGRWRLGVIDLFEGDTGYIRTWSVHITPCSGGEGGEGGEGNEGGEGEGNGSGGGNKNTGSGGGGGDAPPIGAIIGGVVGGLAVVGLIVGAVLYSKRSSNNNEAKASGQGDASATVPSTIQTMPGAATMASTYNNTASSSMVNKTNKVITAPPGRLGLSISIVDGQHTVTNIAADSPVVGQFQVDDKILLVCGESAGTKSSAELMALLSSRAGGTRDFVVERIEAAGVAADVNEVEC
jgi:subtilisin-like proprotein convertase family protein